MSWDKCPCAVIRCRAEGDRMPNTAAAHPPLPSTVRRGRISSIPSHGRMAERLQLIIQPTRATYFAFKMRSSSELPRALTAFHR